MLGVDHIDRTTKRVGERAGSYTSFLLAYTSQLMILFALRNSLHQGMNPRHCCGHSYEEVAPRLSCCCFCIDWTNRQRTQILFFFFCV